MVGVLMGGNGGGKVFGHSYFHPIYEAALELDLPTVVHVGGDAAADATTLTVAAGHPISFTEYSVLSATPLMTHLVSFLVQGVFEKFRGLRILIAGAGAGWLPALLWRLDTNWKGHRREVPWVRRLPSEYLRESVRLTTWPLDRPPDPRQLVATLQAFGDPADLLCYASGWPDWNTDRVEEVVRLLPEAWHDRIFHSNASAFFRWDGQVGPRLEPEVAVGTMAATGRVDIEIVDGGEVVDPNDRGSWSDD
jgi:predicted TIM-barrel fold metal-dependent hydrolase